ncbi:hypothetical protein [uncultured Nostoc sp.]|uniref:hypothetical protein n=1 Tax=uncultured Nostoc sp. TaxID=340711 RepID=UPI0035CA32E0
MKTFLYTSDIPSNRSEVLDSLKGLAILNLTRYSWEPPDRAVLEYGIEAKEVFSLTAGCLIMSFDSGLVIGYGSQPSKNSVTIWVEKNEAAETSEELAEEDNELYPVDATDAVYSNNFWARFVGQRISNITILKRSYSSALYADIANEIGLLFEVEDGSRFIASHGLHDDSDDFSVIQESQIDNEIRNQIQGL